MTRSHFCGSLARVSTATRPPTPPRIALAVEPRLLRDVLALALEEQGFLVVEADHHDVDCDVLVTSEVDEVIDLRAEVVVHVGDGSDITDISDLVATIAGGPGDAPAR